MGEPNEIDIWKKRYELLLAKHKQIVGALKQKIISLMKTEKELIEKHRRELDDLRHQVDFERSQKMSVQSQINQIQTDKVKVPKLDLDNLAQMGNISTEHMMKFREALEAQLKQYSEMLATAEARAAKNDIEISKKEKHNQKLTHQLKKLDERNKELQAEAHRATGTLKQYQNLYEEMKSELNTKEEKHREVSNVKEDEIINLKKELRSKLNEIEDLEHQVHAFDTIKIAMEVNKIVEKVEEALKGQNIQMMLQTLEDLERIRYEMRKFDRSVEQKFVNLALELERSESAIRRKLLEDYKVA